MKTLRVTWVFLLIFLLVGTGLFAGAAGETSSGEIPNYTFYLLGRSHPQQPTVREDSKYYDDWKAALNAELAVDLGFTVDIIDRRLKDSEAADNAVRLAVAAREEGDLFAAPHYMHLRPAWKEVFVPIQDLLNTRGPAIKKLFGDEAGIWNPWRQGDDIFGIPMYSYYLTNPVWMRKDIVESLGVAWPDDVLKGVDLDWFEEVFDKFMARNPDSYGMYSTLGWSQWIYGHYVENIVPHGTGFFYYYDEDTNQLELLDYHPEMREALWRQKQWFDKGYYAPDTFVKSYPERNQALIDGDVIAHVEWHNVTETDPIRGYVTANPDFDGKIMPVSFGIDKYPTVGRANTGIYFLSIGENHDKYMELMNWFYSSQENAILAKYGIEGLTYVVETSAAGNKFITVPEAERSALVNHPRILKGDEFPYETFDFDRELGIVPGDVGKGWIGLRENILYRLGGAEVFMSPIAGMAIDIPQNDMSTFGDTHPFYRGEIQKLWLDPTLSRNEFLEKYFEIVKQAEEMGIRLIVDKYYNPALKAMGN